MICNMFIIYSYVIVILKAQCIIVCFQGWFCSVYLRKEYEPYIGVVVFRKIPLTTSILYIFFWQTRNLRKITRYLLSIRLCSLWQKRNFKKDNARFAFCSFV